MISFIAGLGVLVLLIMPIAGLIDAASTRESTWQAADHNKTTWVLSQIFLWTIGSIAYYLAVKPTLRAVEAEARATEATDCERGTSAMTSPNGPPRALRHWAPS